MAYFEFRANRGLSYMLLLWFTTLVYGLSD